MNKKTIAIISTLSLLLSPTVGFGLTSNTSAAANNSSNSALPYGQNNFLTPQGAENATAETNETTPSSDNGSQDNSLPVKEDTSVAPSSRSTVSNTEKDINTPSTDFRKGSVAKQNEDLNETNQNIMVPPEE